MNKLWEKGSYARVSFYWLSQTVVSGMTICMLYVSPSFPAVLNQNACVLPVLSTLKALKHRISCLIQPTQQTSAGTWETCFQFHWLAGVQQENHIMTNIALSVWDQERKASICGAAGYDDRAETASRKNYTLGKGGMFYIG